MADSEPMYITKLHSMPHMQLPRSSAAVVRSPYLESMESTYSLKPFFSPGAAASDSDSTASPDSVRAHSTSSRTSSSGASFCGEQHLAGPPPIRLGFMLPQLVDGMQSSPPPAMGGAPRLLWCEGNVQSRREEMEALTTRFCNSEFNHFGSPSSFTRWLFEQGVGTVTVPSAVLVVGWREAKPCGAAITAALSGDTSGLRDDCKRPELVKGVCSSVAVKAMIIISENKKHTKHATEWIRNQSVLSKSVHLRLALDSSEVGATLEELMTPPPGLGFC